MQSISDNDEFETIEKQINKTVGNLSKIMANKGSSSVLQKKHAVLQGTFERIEEQAKEESPVKASRNHEEKELALMHSV